MTSSWYDVLPANDTLRSEDVTSSERFLPTSGISMVKILSAKTLLMEMFQQKNGCRIRSSAGEVQHFHKCHSKRCDSCLHRPLYCTAVCIGLCTAQLSASRITDAKCSGSRVSYPKSAKYSKCCAIALESYKSRVLPFLCDRDHEAKALRFRELSSFSQTDCHTSETKNTKYSENRVVRLISTVTGANRFKIAVRIVSRY